jgi:hypothetical protein
MQNSVKNECRSVSINKQLNAADHAQSYAPEDIPLFCTYGNLKQRIQHYDQ